jgi:N-acetylglucosamine-6-phosphate deacetylase
MTIIKSDKIYFEEGVKNGYVVIKDGKFAEFKTNLAQGETCIDYTGYRIIPGIIDTHNHGVLGYGLKVNDGDTETDLEYSVRGYLKGSAKFGLTGVFPTAAHGVFKTIVKIAKEEPFGTKVLGIHSEGPYLNRVGEKGRPRPFPTVDLDLVKQMIKDADGMLKLFALAPEIPGIDTVINLLKKNKVKIAFAHSDLTHDDTEVAIEKGVSVATHLGNVMTGIHHRDIGGCGALLMSPKVECEIICDGFHLSLYFVEMLLRVKDTSRFFMISDSSNLAGMKPGIYKGHFSDVKVHIDELGFIRDEDGRISGSSKSVLYGIGNLVEKLHIPMDTVLKMSSLNAANYYGFGDVKGSIKLGKDADFVVIDKDYHAVSTFVEGRKVYDVSQDVDFNPRYKF